MESQTKRALVKAGDYEREFSARPFEVYRIKDAPESYVAALNRRPVLLPLKGWMQKAYTWFRLGDLNVTPVFADDLSPEEKALFVPAGNAPMRSLPDAALNNAEAPGLKAALRHEKIVVTGAKPGMPLLVKTSYHPGWKASGGERIYLAGPGLYAAFSQVFGPDPGIRPHKVGLDRKKS